MTRSSVSHPEYSSHENLGKTISPHHAHHTDTGSHHSTLRRRAKCRDRGFWVGAGLGGRKRIPVTCAAAESRLGNFRACHDLVALSQRTPTFTTSCRGSSSPATGPLCTCMAHNIQSAECDKCPNVCEAVVTRRHAGVTIHCKQNCEGELFPSLSNFPHCLSTMASPTTKTTAAQTRMANKRGTLSFFSIESSCRTNHANLSST